MTSPAAPGEAALPPGPPSLALAVAFDLVTRYRLRLTDPRDGRLGPLGGDAYVLGAASWTGRRAAFVGFYEPPDDGAAAAADLEQRVAAAERWGSERLGLQTAQQCDILLIALGRVPRPSLDRAGAGSVRVGVLAVDASTADVQTVLPVPNGVPGAGEVRAHARAVLAGKPVPTLAAVDLAERQVVAGGYAQPARQALASQPVVTYGLLAVLVVIWLADRNLLSRLSFLGPINSLFALGASGDAPPESLDWWRYVSNAFLHDPGSPLHILFNGFALFYVGRIVEQLYGRLVLLGVFLLTAVAGALLYAGSHAVGVNGGVGASVGASGAIMGLIGLLLMLGRVQGRDVPVGVVASLRQYAITFTVLTALVGVVVSHVNNWAHAGGLVAGVLIGLVLPPRAGVGGRDLRVWEKGVLAGVIVVSAVALGVAGHNLVSVLQEAPPGVPTLSF